MAPTISAGAEIKRVRQLLAENTTTFGRRLYVSGRTVEDWEQGRRRPSAGTLAHLDRVRRLAEARAAKMAESGGR